MSSKQHDADAYGQEVLTAVLRCTWVLAEPGDLPHITEPVLLGFAGLAIRGRVKR
ncbi:hypothetical protein [Streptomyces sp. WAC01526]|uniref:hypothetical protein n=1 Tax=Streptomyces sp. WAC01526 TaxID=2588709 RepID=UPI001651F63C|nr:hypothetical protein [Streptomyces sp. WAC01526]